MHTPIDSIIRECFWRHEKCDTRSHLHDLSLSLPRESFDDWVRREETSQILIKSYFHPHDSVDKLNLVEMNVISTIVVVISIMWKILHRLLLLHSSWRFSVNFTHNGAELRSIVISSWHFFLSSTKKRDDIWRQPSVTADYFQDDEDHLLALCKTSHAFPYHTGFDAKRIWRRRHSFIFWSGPSCRMYRNYSTLTGILYFKHDLNLDPIFSSSSKNV